MMRTQGQNADMRVAAELMAGMLMLVCGGLIYLLFRSRSLNIYVWCSAVGLADGIEAMRHAVRGWNVGDFLRFSVPDGLYCAASVLVMDAIWGRERGVLKHIAISAIPLFAISSEILQYFGMVKGTFDVCDLICYAIPFAIYCIITFIKNKTS